jgi:Uma2 family endonuclease
MSATLLNPNLAPPAQLQRPRAARLRKAKLAGRRMSLEEFLRLELDEPDGWKYEWKSGQIESDEEAMKSTEWPIVVNLLQAFEQTEQHRRGDALLAEADCLFEKLGALRRPDLAYLTKVQIAEGGRGGHPVPSFVIEIISPNDLQRKVERKLREYFQAGVQTVWQVYPELEMVKTYCSPKDIRVCLPGDRCSAEPALQGFDLAVESIFKREI